jgi:hypothetical protein
MSMAKPISRRRGAWRPLKLGQLGMGGGALRQRDVNVNTTV